VLVDGDPTTDILATRAIRTVWKLGQPVDREAFRRSQQGGRLRPYVMGASALAAVVVVLVLRRRRRR
jgi:hypothetical protein